MRNLFSVAVKTVASASFFSVSFFGSAVSYCAASKGVHVDPVWALSLFAALPPSTYALAKSLGSTFRAMDTFRSQRGMNAAHAA